MLCSVLFIASCMHPFGALAETCILAHKFLGEERQMRISDIEKEGSIVEYLTVDGEWEADPEIPPLFCDEHDVCRSISSSGASTKHTAGVSAALSREIGHAAFAEWRMVDGEILQWVFLTSLHCE